MAGEAQRSDTRAQDRAGRLLRNERRTEVENSWPHVSQDHWCRIWRALTNSDAHAAHRTSRHTGQVGKAKRLIVTPDCVSVCTVIGTSSALSPPGAEPVDVSPVRMMADYQLCLATGWRVYERFLTAVVCSAANDCVRCTQGRAEIRCPAADLSRSNRGPHYYLFDLCQSGAAAALQHSQSGPSRRAPRSGKLVRAAARADLQEGVG